MTIALIFNAKAEVPPTSAIIPEQAEEPPSNASPADSPSHTLRKNDLYAEWDTYDTIHAVRDAIAERYGVELIEANEDAFERLRRLRPAFVFNIAEGLHGVSREAQVPAMLEMLRLPYLGSDPLTLALCLDKARAKEVLAYNGVATAPFVVIRTMDEFEDARVKFPSIVKPLHEGSSKGIYNSCVVRTPEDLEREVRTILATYNQPALVEEFLPGREFTVAILGNGDALRVLPIVEIRFDALPAGMNAPILMRRSGCGTPPTSRSRFTPVPRRCARKRRKRSGRFARRRTGFSGAAIGRGWMCVWTLTDGPTSWN